MSAETLAPILLSVGGMAALLVTVFRSLWTWHTKDFEELQGRVTTLETALSSANKERAEALAKRDAEMSLRQDAERQRDEAKAETASLRATIDTAVAKAVNEAVDPLKKRITTLEQEKKQDDERHTEELKKADVARTEAIEARQTAEKNARDWKEAASTMEKRLAELEQAHKSDPKLPTQPERPADAPAAATPPEPPPDDASSSSLPGSEGLPRS